MIWPFNRDPDFNPGEVLLMPTAIQPMPNVRAALAHMPDAICALERGRQAWNRTQLTDAIRSAEYFLAEAKKALESNPVPMPNPGTTA